jgi:glycosyltransferase involved in cell wall biosynthesis
MQIGIVAPDLREGGGVTEKALFVARTLRDRLGADVRVVSLATSSGDACSRLLRRPRTWTRPLHGSYRFEEFTVTHCGAVAADIEVARYLPRAFVLERLRGCDVVHVVGGTPAWGLAVRGFGGPLVLHFASFAGHERVSTSPAWRSPLDGWRRMMTMAVGPAERAALRRADLVVTVNDTRRQEVEAIVGRERRVAMVHTGVDTEWFRPRPYDADGYLLAVGRLADPRKNVALLLRAYAAARARSARVPRLVLAGHSAPDASTWRLRSNLGLVDSVEYRGALDRDALASAYRGASAFVLSSDEEGQGIVILEAMASGLPVIATSCVGPPELVTDGTEGFLVPVRSVGALADAIVRLSDDRALRLRLSGGARLRATRDFSLEAAAARLCAAYRAAGIAPEAPRSAADLVSGAADAITYVPPGRTVRPCVES